MKPEFCELSRAWRNLEYGVRATVILGLLAIGLTACATATVAISKPAVTAPSGEGRTFDEWVREFRAYAIGQGISPETYDTAFRGVRLNVGVSQSNENQPEFTRAFWDYLNRAASPERIRNGQEKLAANRTILDQAHKQYGVNPEIVVAIWGLESGYGANLGSLRVIEALATLAYRGTRANFGREQLLAALKILQEKSIAPERMTGSWAGAMGHTQFIPTTYLRHAVDQDRDGARNLWDSLPDVFGSTANYLNKSGWVRNQPCYFEVRLPAGFDYAQAEISVKQSLNTWIDRGVRRMDGRSLMGAAALTPDTKSAILVPAGYQGPAFLVFDNFNAVLAYNNAHTYAMSICLLAERIKGEPGILASWPQSDPPLLSTADRVELQSLLSAKVENVGDADGVIGRKTRAAVRAFQKSVGRIPDGYATQSLLAALRKHKS